MPGVAPPFVGIVKTYPPQGSLQLYRLAQTISFRCSRCGAVKTSKLIATYGNGSAARLCNGCYGWLISVYGIKHGPETADQRAAALSQKLLEIASEADARDAARRARFRTGYADLLDPRSVRFLGTAQLIAERLADLDLDWSVGIIGLCKALELELLLRLIDPLRTAVDPGQLAVERDGPDRELSRLAGYLLQPDRQSPPELGWIGRFLSTAARSERRAATSPLIRAFRARVVRSPGSLWLGSDEAATAVSGIAERFRNRAAHIDELSRADFDECRDAIVGQAGTLWTLVDAAPTVHPRDSGAQTPGGPAAR